MTWSDALDAEVVRNAATLACIFLAMVPWVFFLMVAERSHQYAYEEGVVEKEGNDRDETAKKKKYLESCTEHTPGARHRADNARKKYKFTPGFVLCFFGMLILQGAHFGSNKRHGRSMWRSPPYGFSLPYVRNAMPCNSYEFMRRFIHFADNSTRVAKGLPGYNILYKVRYPMTELMKGICKAWVAGKHVTINESMISYMG